MRAKLKKTVKSKRFSLFTLQIRPDKAVCFVAPKYWRSEHSGFISGRSHFLVVLALLW
jgi:hypothetical protein